VSGKFECGFRTDLHLADMNVPRIGVFLQYLRIRSGLFSDRSFSHPLLLLLEFTQGVQDFWMVLADFSQFLHVQCIPLLDRVMFFDHLLYPARAVQSVKEDILPHQFQLVLVNNSLCEVGQQSVFGVGSI
jgi:hypothetical protein